MHNSVPSSSNRVFDDFFLSQDRDFFENINDFQEIFIDFQWISNVKSMEIMKNPLFQNPGNVVGGG